MAWHASDPRSQTLVFGNRRISSPRPFAKLAKVRNQPDWGRRGVYAAYIIGVPSLLLAIVAYLKPPDPAHPIRFDFLFRSVPVPLWLIILLPVVAICVALLLRFLSPRLTKSIVQDDKPLNVRLRAPAPSSRPKTLTNLIGKDGEVVIPTADQLDIRIEADDSTDQPTLKLKVDNNRLDAIQEIDTIIYSAFSFDTRRNEFRTHPAATGSRTVLPSPVLPSESSQNVLLVHKRAGKDHLQLGNDDQRVMKWPENDKAQVQRWKLNLSVGARVFSRTIPLTGEVFKPTTFDLIIEWDTASNRLTVEKG